MSLLLKITVALFLVHVNSRDVQTMVMTLEVQRHLEGVPQHGFKAEQLCTENMGVQSKDTPILYG